MTNEQRLLALEIVTWASLASSGGWYGATRVREAYFKWRTEPQQQNFDVLLQLAKERYFPGLDQQP